MIGLRCPIDGAALWTCGDDHMIGPPVDIPPPLGETMLITNSSGEPPAPPKLKEYSYYVGQVEHTAMLTEKMAADLGAKPVGEEPAEETPTPAKVRPAPRNKRQS